MAIVSVLVMFPAGAQAHSILIGSSPSDGAQLANAPSAVSFTFNEDLLSYTDTISINDDAGKNQCTPAVQRFLSRGHLAFAAELSKLPTEWLAPTGTRSVVRSCSRSVHGMSHRTPLPARPAHGPVSGYGCWLPRSWPCSSPSSHWSLSMPKSAQLRRSERSLVKFSPGTSPVRLLRQ